jgi:hypothetical protein
VPETLGGGVGKGTDTQPGLAGTVELGTVAVASTVEVGIPPEVVRS